MKKQILKILICTLILLIGIGAASAIEDTSTDETISFEEPDQMVSVSDIDEEISGDEGNNEVLAAESDGAVELESASGEIQTSEAGNEELKTAEGENNNAISVNEKDVLTMDVEKTEKLTDTNSTSDDAQTKVEYKTFNIAKLKIAKKYKKYYSKNASEVPKKVKKHMNKSMKKMKKSAIKKMKKLKKNHWTAYSMLKPSFEKNSKYYV